MGWIFQPASQANAAAESGNKSTISAAVIMVVRMGVVRWAARNAEAGPGCWRCYSLRKSLRNMVSAIMGGATSAPSWLGRIQSFPPRRRGAGGWHRRPAVGRRFPTARAGWPARLKNARAPRHSGDGSGQALIDVLWNVAEGQRFTHGTMPAFCKEGGLVAGIKNWNQERRKSDDS